MTRRDVRVLGPADLSDFLALVGRDPVVNVFADHRARSTRLDERWLGGQVWGLYRRGSLVAACHVGANLVPVGAQPEDACAFAEHALARRRQSSTIVGPVAAVEPFWSVVADEWGPPRETRWCQPHLELTAVDLRADEGLAGIEVRRTERSDLDALFPACVAMYTEEVGVSPEQGGGLSLYRSRVLQLISRGWSFASFDRGGQVVFKAEVACASPYAAQIQGVYVPPDLRGRGLARAGMAAVARVVLRDIAPVVSLYVNDWNRPARATYEAIGFRQTETFATIMF